MVCKHTAPPCSAAVMELLHWDRGVMVLGNKDESNSLSER